LRAGLHLTQWAEQRFPVWQRRSLAARPAVVGLRVCCAAQAPSCSEPGLRAPEHMHSSSPGVAARFGTARQVRVLARTPRRRPRPRVARKPSVPGVQTGRRSPGSLHLGRGLARAGRADRHRMMLTVQRSSLKFPSLSDGRDARQLSPPQCRNSASAQSNTRGRREARRPRRRRRRIGGVR